MPALPPHLLTPATTPNQLTQSFPSLSPRPSPFPPARMPILPPLKKVFAVIEAQREEEAALGDAPLDQLLMPVPVPDEIVPPPEINELDPHAREMPIPVAEAEPSFPGMGMEGPLPEQSWPGEQGHLDAA